MMAEKKVIVTTQNKVVAGSTHVTREPLVKQQASALPLFEKENYQWMVIGAVVVALGMFLMAGGKNTDPNQFDYNLVYSKMRITVAPILILAGLMVEIYAIFKRPKVQAQ